MGDRATMTIDRALPFLSRCAISTRPRGLKVVNHLEEDGIGGYARKERMVSSKVAVTAYRLPIVKMLECRRVLERSEQLILEQPPRAAVRLPKRSRGFCCMRSAIYTKVQIICFDRDVLCR